MMFTFAFGPGNLNTKVSNLTGWTANKINRIENQIHTIAKAILQLPLFRKSSMSLDPKIVKANVTTDMGQNIHF